MKGLPKRILAILLIIALLATVSVLQVVNAEDSESFNTALIDAWNNLATETSEVIAHPNSAMEISYYDSELAGLTAEQKALLGTHVSKLDSVNKVANGWKPVSTRTIDNFYKITYSAYSTGTTGIECIIRYDDDNKYVSGYPWFTGFGTVDITTLLNNNMPGKAIYTNKQARVSGATVYVGSIIGWGKAYASAPDDADSMTPKELYEVASKVDLTQYNFGVSQFKKALEDVYADLYPEAAALIQAWNNLVTERTEVIAVPNTDTKIKVDENTVVDGLSDTSVLGEYYVDKASWAAGWDNQLSHKKVVENCNLSEYKSVYFYLSAFDANNNPIQVRITTQVENANAKDTWATGWTKIEYYKLNKVDPGLKCICTYDDSKMKYVSYGAVIGLKEVQEASPENAATMNLEELYNKAE